MVLGFRTLKLFNYSLKFFLYPSLFRVKLILLRGLPTLLTPSDWNSYECNNFILYFLEEVSSSKTRLHTHLTKITYSTVVFTHNVSHSVWSSDVRVQYLFHYIEPTILMVRLVQVLSILHTHWTSKHVHCQYQRIITVGE